MLFALFHNQGVVYSYRNADIMETCFSKFSDDKRRRVMFNFTALTFLFSMGLLLFGGLLSFVLHKRPRLSIAIGFGSSIVSVLGILTAGLRVLISAESLNVSLPWRLLGNPLVLSVRSLSAFFLVVIAVTVLAVSVFSYSYVTEYITKHNIGVLGLLFNLFVFAMAALVSSDSTLMFIFFWELMSLASYFLVMYDHNNPTVRRAGFIYVVMTHIGTAFIVAAFMLMYKETGSFSFSDYSAAGPDFPAKLKTLIFLLATVGFGTKAGIIPLHVWLPKAHPAAPSNVSAVMSGVMLKTAIYGFLKVVLEGMGGGPVWWGVVILIIGTVSALLGVLYALMEQDIKRLLAYSSVENIGIILMGLGCALIFTGTGSHSLAAIALTAALLHVLNHAIFKGLLFLGAGAVHFSTHTRDLEQLGGLLKRMPWTGFFFLIGSISISGLPPFNGFVSEWLTFQSVILLGAGENQLVVRILGPLCGALLALTGALAAACFVKAFGIQFLALPRSKRAEKAGEVPFSMRLGMGMLALLCFLIGVLPTFVIRLLSPVTLKLTGAETLHLLGGLGWLSVISPGMKTAVSPAILLVILAVSGFLIYLAVRAVGPGGSVRVDETWNCGMVLTPKMEYTATSFSKPIRIIFRLLFQPKGVVEKEYDLAPYFPNRIKYHSSIKPVFEDAIYRPVTILIIKIADKIRLLQSGSIHLYLSYIFITLVILLIFAR